MFIRVFMTIILNILSEIHVFLLFFAIIAIICGQVLEEKEGGGYYNVNTSLFSGMGWNATAATICYKAGLVAILGKLAICIATNIPKYGRRRD